jgi:signal transduction histidine kinase
MRERATMLDGEVNIIGRQGKGTTVGVRIPMQSSGETMKK